MTAATKRVRSAALRTAQDGARVARQNPAASLVLQTAALRGVAAVIYAGRADGRGVRLSWVSDSGQGLGGDGAVPAQDGPQG